MQVEGSLHILQLDPQKDTYSVSFAPWQGQRGALSPQQIDGQDGLTQYLRRLNIHEDIIEATLQDLRRDRRSTIPNLILPIQGT